MRLLPFSVFRSFSLTVSGCPTTRLLEKFKIFTAFYHLSELRSREDLMKLIIENLDYSTWVSLVSFDSNLDILPETL